MRLLHRSGASFSLATRQDRGIAAAAVAAAAVVVAAAAAAATPLSVVLSVYLFFMLLAAAAAAVAVVGADNWSPGNGDRCPVVLSIGGLCGDALLRQQQQASAAAAAAAPASTAAAVAPSEPTHTARCPSWGGNARTSQFNWLGFRV